MVSFWVRKASTLVCSRCEAAVSFSSSACSDWYCVCRSVSWLCSADLRVSASRASPHRLRGLPVQLVLLLLQRVHLQLDTLTRRGHVSDAAADLRQHLQLALVGVVQGLARIFHPVQGLIGLGLEDHRYPLHHAHRRDHPLIV